MVWHAVSGHRRLNVDDNMGDFWEQLSDPPDHNPTAGDEDTEQRMRKLKRRADDDVDDRYVGTLGGAFVGQAIYYYKKTVDVGVCRVNGGVRARCASMRWVGSSMLRGKGCLCG